MRIAGALLPHDELDWVNRPIDTAPTPLSALTQLHEHGTLI